MNEEKPFPEENQEDHKIETLPQEADSGTVVGNEDAVPGQSADTVEPDPLTAEETRPEDSPMFDAETAPVEEPPKKQTPSWVKKTLIWFVILVLVFLSGVIVSQLTSVTPLRNNLFSVTNQSIEQRTEIEDLKAELESTQNELSDTKSELSDTRAMFTESNQTLVASQQELQRQTGLLDLKFNIAEARVAAANEDKLSLRQSLNLAEKNLAQLEDILEPEIYEIIQERLETIQKSTKSNLTKAVEELRMLSENLIRIE